MRRLASTVAAAALAAASAASLGLTCAQHEPVGRQLFSSPQANPLALSPDGSRLYVAATTSHRLDVIDTATAKRTAFVDVGLDPVAVAVRPDGLEVWVANHVSDSVSVVDTDPASPTFQQVVATVQAFTPEGATDFDEPVGIAFAGTGKAYVALSSTNRIAVVDVATRSVTGHIPVRAQEPRAIAVRNGLLYVAAFESGNRTQISLCANLFGDGQVGSPCSLGLAEFAQFAVNPNLPGAVKNIVVDSQLPDRDLFVYDTGTDGEIAAVSGVGTLLYGLAVDSTGRALLTQTDARNAVNGDQGQNLVDLDNRMFLNQVAAVACNAGGCGAPTVFELEPAPPAQPAPGAALATPYGIAISDDDATAVATAAGTSRLFTLDAASGAVLGILDLGSGAEAGQQIPRGVALRSGPGGAPETAWVLNTLENTVSVVDVTSPAAPVETAEIEVGADPTPDAVRRGRIAFNNAFASDSATFSCGSCHPDGNTDQLLWRIGGACFFGQCSGHDEPRSTMPIRGLANTLPLHWDGTLGDPFGGPNGAVGGSGSGGTSCALGDADGAHDCFVDLVEASLAGVMCDQGGSCPAGGNRLSAAERDDMARFLAGVSYPPARSRRLDDGLSASAVAGFSDFFTDQGGLAGDPDTCADSDAGCHELPLGAATNSSTLAGFDAPTMRGLTDRFLQFSLGPTNAREALEAANDGLNVVGLVSDPLEPELRWDPAVGFREESTFGAAFLLFQPVYGNRPVDIFAMLEEASTGFSGALGRQVTLDAATTAGGALAGTEALMDALELGDERGLVNLRAVGMRDAGPGWRRVFLSYRAGAGEYRDANGGVALTHGDLVAEAQAGTLVVTLTGALPKNFGSEDFRQPLLAPPPGSGPTGDPGLPMDPGPGSPMSLVGVDVREDAAVWVDGQPAGGTVACVGGSFSPYCTSQQVTLTLDAVPAGDGLHLVQVQNPSGPLSNELPVCVGPAAGCQ